MNKKYHLVSDILNEGIRTAIGNTMGKIAKKLGRTSKEATNARWKNGVLSKWVGLHPKNRKWGRLRIGYMAGLRG